MTWTSCARLRRTVVKDRCLWTHLLSLLFGLAWAASASTCVEGSGISFTSISSHEACCFAVFTHARVLFDHSHTLTHTQVWTFSFPFIRLTSFTPVSPTSWSSPTYQTAPQHHLPMFGCIQLWHASLWYALACVPPTSTTPFSLELVKRK